MTEALEVRAIETGIFRLGENLVPFIARSVPRALVQERMVLAVTSKIISIAEKRVVAKTEVRSKEELVRRECDHYLGTIGYDTSLTISHGILIPAAGIDESNAEEDFYILYPQDPYASARSLWTALRKEWDLDQLGILFTDSHTTPLRRGVTGIGLAFWGFAPTENLVGVADLFGRPFKMTHVNRVDALSAAAVFMMGEGTRPRPLAVIRGAALEFSEEDLRSGLEIPLEEDLYHPVLQPLLQSGQERK